MFTLDWAIAGPIVILIDLALLLFVVSMLFIRWWKKGSHRRKLDKDTCHVLLVLDRMLAKLPKKEIRRFAKSKDFKIYERVMRRVRVR